MARPEAAISREWSTRADPGPLFRYRRPGRTSSSTRDAWLVLREISDCAATGILGDPLTTRLGHRRILGDVGYITGEI